MSSIDRSVPRPQRRRLLAASSIGALLLAAGFAGCSSFEDQQSRWIFQPSKEAWWGGQGAAQGMETVWIDFDSKVAKGPARLNGLWLAADKPKAPVLLYLHGARWDVTGSAARMRRMQSLGFSVLAIDYRGFGQSTDMLPSEASSYEDAHAAWHWLAEHYPDHRRFVFGHSLGSAIAVDLAASEPDVSGLIVEGGFPSVASVFGTFRWGWLPVSALITQRFDAGRKIAHVKTPVLVVHGSADQLIPPRLGEALYDKAPEPKRFVLVEGGSHHSTNTIGQDQYRQAVRDMFGVAPGAS